MKKFRLTNPIEQPVPGEKNLMYLSNALTKYQWLFLVGWTILIGLLFYFIGRYVGKQHIETPRRNPYLPDEDSNDIDDPSSNLSKASKNNNSSTS